jgi:hypothetical protein
MITARRPFLRALATAGAFSAVGFPAATATVGAAIPGVGVDYKRCKVAFVSNASAIDAIAVYYADRNGERNARYDIAPTVTNPRGYAPLVVEYDADEDRTQIQLAEPRGALVCIIAEAGADRTVVTNPTAVCVPAGFNTAPTASFTVSDDPTVGEAVTFTSTATDPDSPERLFYAWDLDGDGTFEVGGEIATTTFLTPGEKTLSHRVTDDLGATATATRTITVVAGDNETLFEQISRLTVSDGAGGDQLGFSVGIAGDTAVVGAPSKDDNAVNGGAAYVFERNQGGTDNWGEVTRLTVSDGESGGQFGWSVGIAGDTAIVGALSQDEKGRSAGAAYVFERNQGGTDNWGEMAKLTASDGESGDVFGISVGIAGDTAIVGARDEDENGLNAGAAYVFGRNQGGADNWGEVAKLTASDGESSDAFGQSVGIAGDTAVVGAPFEDDNGTNAGAAYVFGRNQRGADTWGEVTKLTASDGAADDRFGFSVGIAGDTAIVGAPGENNNGNNTGAVYVFERNTGGADNWGEVTKLTANDGATGDAFGVSVRVAGDTAIVGAFLDDDKGFNAGAAYIFERNRGGTDNWGKVAKLTASDGAGGDLFGRSVGIAGDTAIVGTPSKDDKGFNAGAAYIFE